MTVGGEIPPRASVNVCAFAPPTAAAAAVVVAAGSGAALVAAGAAVVAAGASTVTVTAVGQSAVADWVALAAGASAATPATAY